MNDGKIILGLIFLVLILCASGWGLYRSSNIITRIKKFKASSIPDESQKIFLQWKRDYLNYWCSVKALALTGPLLLVAGLFSALLYPPVTKKREMVVGPDNSVRFEDSFSGGETSPFGFYLGVYVLVCLIVLVVFYFRSRSHPDESAFLKIRYNSKPEPESEPEILLPPEKNPEPPHFGFHTEDDMRKFTESFHFSDNRDEEAKPSTGAAKLDELFEKYPPIFRDVVESLVQDPSRSFADIAKEHGITTKAATNIIKAMHVRLRGVLSSIKTEDVASFVLEPTKEIKVSLLKAWWGKIGRQWKILTTVGVLLLLLSLYCEINQQKWEAEVIQAAKNKGLIRIPGAESRYRYFSNPKSWIFGEVGRLRFTTNRAVGADSNRRDSIEIPVWEYSKKDDQERALVYWFGKGRKTVFSFPRNSMSLYKQNGEYDFQKASPDLIESDPVAQAILDFISVE